MLYAAKYTNYSYVTNEVSELGELMKETDETREKGEI